MKNKDKKKQAKKVTRAFKKRNAKLKLTPFVLGLIKAITVLIAATVCEPNITVEILTIIQCCH